jgi:hypothetical protein
MTKTKELRKLIDDVTVDAYKYEDQLAGFPSAPTKPSNAASPSGSSAPKSNSSRSTPAQTPAPV